MELHAIRGDRRDHVLTTHRAEEDETALQLVSAKKVAYWQTLEVDYQALLEKLGEGEQPR
jgi:hypothetical protein